MPAAPNRPVASWLFAWCALLFTLVLVGGVTRLTESGLSITQWRPLSGVVPPLTAAAWDEEFAGYRRIPEFQRLRPDMTLGEFKHIYWWEYAHRLLARLLGVAFALPLLWFAVTRRIRGRLVGRLAVILLGIGAQGALGWYMVSSGLVDRTDVSQYRLAAHLGLALLLYAFTFWTALSLSPAEADPGDRRLAPFAAGYVGAVFLTILAGAFVAGLDAGKGWNTFPLMGGSFIPAGYGQFEPFWRNWFENAAAVQFHHRWLGVTMLLGAVALWGAARRSPSARVRVTAGWLIGMAGLQVFLGISTLLLQVPIPLAATHQAGAVMLLTLALTLAHACRGAGLTGEGGGPSLPEA